MWLYAMWLKSSSADRGSAATSVFILPLGFPALEPSFTDVRCLCFSQHGLNVRAPGFWNIFRGFCPFPRVDFPTDAHGQQEQEQEQQPTTPASIIAAFRTVTGYSPTRARARKPTMALFNYRSKIVRDAGRSKLVLCNVAQVNIRWVSYIQTFGSHLFENIQTPLPWFLDLLSLSSWLVF